MRWFALGLLLVGTLLFLGIQFSKKSDDFNARYVATVHKFYTRIDANVPQQSVILLGDSLIQGLATSSLGQSVFNFGIGTDTTSGLNRRLEDYKSVKVAKCLVVHIGVNDLFRSVSPERFVQNYHLLLEKIPTKTTVIVSSLLPVEEVKEKLTNVNKKIKEMNELLRHLSSENEQYVYHDIWLELLGAEGELNSEYHVGDGLHLNGLGNALWLDSLKSLLTESGCVNTGQRNE